jgi:hypothetical protein
MTDIANTLNAAVEPANGDGTVLSFAGAGLLLLLLLVAALLPFDLAQGPAYVPSLFGP